MKEAEKEKLAEMLEDARSLFEGVQMDWHMGEEVGNEIERLKAIHTILNRIWPEIGQYGKSTSALALNAKHSIKKRGKSIKRQ